MRIIQFWFLLLPFKMFADDLNTRIKTATTTSAKSLVGTVFHGLFSNGYLIVLLAIIVVAFFVCRYKK